MLDLKCSVLAVQTFVFPLVSFRRKYVAVFYKQHRPAVQLHSTVDNVTIFKVEFQYFLTRTTQTPVIKITNCNVRCPY